MHDWHLCRFGNTVLVHFEDMSYSNLTRLFNQNRGSLACFSDDVQVRHLLVFHHQPLPRSIVAGHVTKNAWTRVSDSIC